MPQITNVDGFDYKFPAGWKISRYDQWTYYRSNSACGKKAVDILAISDDQTGYLIEIKDYSQAKVAPPSELPQILHDKVLHTLGMLLPAVTQATQAEEKNLATQFLKSKTLHVVFHIEQPSKPMPVIDLADIKDKLQPCLRGIDPQFAIVAIGSNSAQGLPWRFRRTGGSKKRGRK